MGGDRKRMSENPNHVADAIAFEVDAGMTLSEMIALLKGRWKLLTLGPIAAGLLALGVAFTIPPTFTARTSFLPPQQAQGGAASALASLGALAGLAGGSAGVSSAGERYVALLQSTNVSERLVENFKLMEVYEAKFRVNARKELAANVRVALGKKDGLITIDVDDKNPQRSADIANGYVDELRRLTGTLAVTEAQQRRAFFERHLQESRDRLTQAQQALEESGFSPGALKAEPKAAAEAYARLKAESTAADLRLNVVRNSLADNTPEVKQQLAIVAALRGQLSRAEQSADTPTGPSYVSKYREFKYQEALFEVYARQFELARADESREGAIIQVVDVAMPPEVKSKPRRGLIAVVTTLMVGVVLMLWVARQRGLQRLIRDMSESKLSARD